MSDISGAVTADIVAAEEFTRIQALRGLACLLLVSFHVIGAEPTQGLQVAPDSPYVTFMEIFQHLRMPLFTFLSGFVYAYRPMRDGKLFVRKKLQRLLVPLLVVSTAYFLLQQSVAGANLQMPLQDIWKIYVFSYAHFWFLQAIILIFLAVAVLEHFRLMQSPQSYLAVFGLVLLAHLFLWVPNVFSAQRALYLAPFFLAGLGANRFRDHLQSGWLRLAIAVVFAISFGLFVIACLNDWSELPGRRSSWGTLIGLSGCLTLIYLMPGIRWLAWIGGFSFSIYLYHVFFTAGARMALNGLGTFNVHDQFVVGLVMGVAGPLLLEIVVRRHTLGRRILLGQS